MSKRSAECEYLKRRRAESFAAGICTQCFRSPASPGSKRCERCRTRSTAAVRKSIALARQEGRCIHCRSRPATSGVYCDVCRIQNREKMRASLKRLRREALVAYGGPVCKCCGETTEAFLTLDHIDGGGRKSKREDEQKSGSRFYRWLKRNGYPPGLQVLCFNCNSGRAINGGVCPHQEKNS